MDLIQESRPAPSCPEIAFATAPALGSPSVAVARRVALQLRAYLHDQPPTAFLNVRGVKCFFEGLEVLATELDAGMWKERMDEDSPVDDYQPDRGDGELRPFRDLS